jgi:hypothetical protein
MMTSQDDPDVLSPVGLGGESSILMWELPGFLSRAKARESMAFWLLAIDLFTRRQRMQ